ncbi:MAG: hypothetical protein M1816_004391 [Peltula sp. TS41687]|nr:MAG: hypothetical protein M1816_004391 [Peltula sp. TS41687]
MEIGRAWGIPSPDQRDRLQQRAACIYCGQEAHSWTGLLHCFIQQPVSKEMISYLAHQASSTIPCGRIPVQTSTPQSRGVTLPSVETFIRQLVRRSNVGVGILMSTLVYLDRVRQSLPATVSRAFNCTIHRIFLASLILAAKNLNDSSPKNLWWARNSHVPGYGGWGFSLPDVNLMEKQLLSILEWNVRITEIDLLSQLERFLARASVGVLEPPSRLPQPSSDRCLWGRLPCFYRQTRTRCRPIRMIRSSKQTI